MKTLTLFIILTLCCFFGHTQLPGTNIVQSVPVDRFNDCLLKEVNPQTVYIYLPPSYYIDTLKRYPVVYFLPGFGSPASYFSPHMDVQIATGKAKEMIVVTPNSMSRMIGSFYVNSPLTGNWDDYISIDLVSYMDNHYRTIAKPEARAITGHSMGGFGALNLSMLHPDIFCIGYGLSPGLFGEKGVLTSQILTQAMRNGYFAFVESIKGLSREEAHKVYLNAISYKINGDNQFSFAYGSAFSADTSLIAPYLNFPFSKNGSQLVTDSVFLKNYENGFGNLKEKVGKYKSNLEKLKGYVIDYGISDEYNWIPQGCVYYDKLLTEAGINHEHRPFAGTHSSNLDSRIKEYMLPFCSSILEFDSAHFNTECRLTGVKLNNIVGTTIIDTISKTIQVIVKPSADLTKIKLALYISSGAKITPASNVATDYSKGSIDYLITSEDGIKSESWNVTVSKEMTSINSSREGKELLVYPNPASNHLFLKCDEKNISVQISDIQGKMVLKTVSNNNSPIDISSLKDGMYFIKANGNKCSSNSIFLVESK
jgi:S-formylglutathione hydrolase